MRSLWLRLVARRAVASVGVCLGSDLGSVSDVPSELALVLDLGLDCTFATVAKAGGTSTTCRETKTQNF